MDDIISNDPWGTHDMATPSADLANKCNGPGTVTKTAVDRQISRIRTNGCETNPGFC